ncbi:MAG TPA: ferrous iron transport protein B [Candidatus Marinimicrobia bacterium]|jgi:ferrous iron transport protein B|nr:ferrous iron transport protein B [Candidatus Neomarinimicrobiota bacterium]HBN45953.1 ferrous iron transport protein B [Candidatus Neomarinimicrobiota bacterium]HJL75230.1 ferrous iron transport protein B [Candidatus Neomarinimicrobiota bacterium]HJM70215.1 ferrous iron transport protein B [Candidatus Neomarinimicrobiota bacterium]|tara:strand:- start:19109 stop:21253 length:2145 start_codon:yes stop_codon:yes gene_type:complete
MKINTQKSWVALVGNPNSGKTAIFNLLTGLNQKVSNYPGVTVEKKIGTAHFNDGNQFNLLDLPGTYSLTPESMDERIVTEQVLHWIHGHEPPNTIISVVDATNLSRNLYLTTQLADLGIPVVVALNMMDMVKDEFSINLETLATDLGIAAIVPMSATEKWGQKELLDALQKSIAGETAENSFPIFLNDDIAKALYPLKEMFVEHLNYNERLANAQALRLVTRKSTLEIYNDLSANGMAKDESFMRTLRENRQAAVEALEDVGIKHRIMEATLRYEWLDSVLTTDRVHIDAKLTEMSYSEKVDKILTHKWAGPAIFVLLLYFIFQSIFTWATVPMDWIDRGVGWIGNQVLQLLSAGMLRDLLVEGVIAGVGAILIFLPQILILMFFMTILEDTGYMARVAFMMDRFMTRIGLHGRSVLPLMSGYACAIPGIMSTRTLDSWKERLITILILPLMSCSARLPVYALMIVAFIPAVQVFGFLNLQGLTLVAMYFLGTATAFILAKIFSIFIKVESKSSFVMELPPYRTPLWRSVLHQVFNRGKLFVVNAGKIILAISIVLWFLASFPKVEEVVVNENPIRTSYAGKIGHTIEPLIEPLGFDWKLGIGLITSFAAREVLVSTMATIYNVQSDVDDVVQLKDAMKSDLNPKTGLPLYTPLVALSLMVFFVFAAQCMATFAIVRNETNSWKWPLFMIVYMNGLAYGASFIVYQGGLALGFG